MSNESLHVVSVDYLPDHLFVMYFSDGTFATVSGRELAECIPERKREWEKPEEENGSLKRLL
jgi:hypothetical protein